MKEREIVIDIEGCVETTNDEGNRPIVADKVGNVVSVTVSVDEVCPDSSKATKKEKRESMSAKKPPRPPRGLSLDAADQKLIKEISELVMIKRARVERLKALKKMKAAQASALPSSSSFSSTGNLLAVLFTLLFCVMLLFRGGGYSMNRLAAGILGSP